MEYNKLILNSFPIPWPVSALTALRSASGYICCAWANRRAVIGKEQNFEECVVLDREAFDPDAVFLDDIVDDRVLPRLSLAVDGLTGAGRRARRALEMRPADVAEEAIPASTTMPVASLGPDQLEVYGWESSLWRRIRGYLGF